MLASLLLTCAAALAPDHCDACSAKAPCKPHAEHVAAALESLESDLESDDPTTRGRA